MKTLTTVTRLCLLLAATLSVLATEAQADLEFASGGGPTGLGISTANQVVTFKQNTNNPTGNTFAAFSSPTTTATFSFSNQQYTLPTTQMSAGVPLVFGAAINNNAANALTTPLYTQMSYISSPSNSDFTSLSTLPAGTGISCTNNYATEFMVSAMPLYNAGLSTTGRFYMGDLNITFNVPLTNPVIHLVGVGAFAGNLGFTSEFELINTGITLTELSGSTEMTVASNKILNNAAHPSSTTGNGAFSGSVVAQGINITSISFRVYLRGDGGASTWANNNNSHSGDQILIGVSTSVPVAVLPISLDGFTATPAGGKTKLDWTTLTENNTSFFDIQYSTNQVNWRSLGTVTAAGNSDTEKKYAFIHADPAPGANYYRLRIVDADGHSTLSEIRELSFTGPSQITAYPNPTRGAVTITGAGTTITAVTVLALDGRPLQQLDNFVSGNSINLSQYPAGLYFITVKDAAGKTRLLKIFRE